MIANATNPIADEPGRARRIDGITDPTMKLRWLGFFLAIFPLVALWAVVNPMLASPDETTHIVRAQGIANLDFTSPFTTDGIPLDAVECFRFLPEVSASCQQFVWGPDGLEQASPTDNYPGFFHAIAAVPAVFTSGLQGAYIMRLWLGALSVMVVSWSGVLLTRPGAGPWPVTGLAVAMTPMVVFTMATVNPSGLASAFASLFVAGTLALRTAYRRRPEVVVAVAVGAVGLALMRRDGLLWLALIALTLVPLVDFTRLRSFERRVLHRSTRTRAVVTVTALSVVVLASLSWAVPTAVQFFRERADGGGTDPWEAARYIRMYVNQAVGTFGWLDSPIGEEAFLVAAIVAGFVVILGVLGADRRLATSTALAVATVLLSPVAIGMVTFPYLQGRYLLPMWVCALVVAGASASASGLDARLSRLACRLLLVLWLIVQVVGFVQNLRRYAVGRSGSWNFVFEADWHPNAMSNSTAVALFVVAACLTAFLFARLLRATEGDRHDVAPADEHPEAVRPLREVDATSGERSTNRPPGSPTR